MYRKSMSMNFPRIIDEPVDLTVNLTVAVVPSSMPFPLSATVRAQIEHSLSAGIPSRTISSETRVPNYANIKDY